MLTVEIDMPAFESAKQALIERIQKRIQGACEAAAGELAAQYRGTLLEIQSPEHSPPGSIPHRYDGYREGGYFDPGGTSGMNRPDSGGSPFSDAEMRSVFDIEFDPSTSFDFGGAGERHKNNAPPEFAKVQGDDEFLATFITHGSTDAGAVVGFTAENSHVTSREQNYLIQHDQGTVPEYMGVERPWVDEIYEAAKPAMVDAFQQFLASGSASTVPF